jgi:CRISPR-associated endonuclease Csn1
MSGKFPYRLSLDLGASSLGWAILALDPNSGEPTRIHGLGVRIFEAGVEGDIEQGKDSSRAVVRRQARQSRRQQWRRQHRKQKLFDLLQKLGLLPNPLPDQPSSRKAVLDALDAELSTKLITAANHENAHDAAQKLPYLLRDKAATSRVEPFELGRALYHLGQRRGYLSNRKTQSKDEDEGQVVSAISEMQTKLDTAGLTLGAFFNREEHPAVKRIRRRWLGREQYRREFLKIRDIQSPAFPRLTPADWKNIYDTIFYQRPLKSQRHLIGRCELERDSRGKGLQRCAIALPIAQEFRLLQKVNDLRVTTIGRFNDPLTASERKKLLAELREHGDLTWSKVRKLLGLNKSAKFSHEYEHKSDDDDDKLIDHRTNAKMSAVFGSKWFGLSEEEQTAIVLEVLHYRKPEKLKQRAMNIWSLSEEAAEKLKKTQLEEGYAAHSKLALERLVRGEPDAPGMSTGVAYQTVRKALYPERFDTAESHKSLPPVLKWSDDIRNPAVIRALTELRKVVNELIAKYGAPKNVHIELAREIRNSRDKRKDIYKKNKENETRRKKAALQIATEVGMENPRRRDIEKWLLADECNRECPYCGRTINMRNLMAGDAEFNVEHIFPRRYIDNSYLNKTIACRACNDSKGDRTPATAFDGERLQQILQRVERFQGTAREIKLARFKTEIPDPGFVERQLNDTKYNSRVAAAYLTFTRYTRLLVRPRFE